MFGCYFQERANSLARAAPTVCDLEADTNVQLDFAESPFSSLVEPSLPCVSELDRRAEVP